MTGSIIFTGANGSLAIPAIKYLLTKYPSYTVILTVRDASDADVNTKRLRDTLSPYTDAKVFYRKLDLSDLSAVTSFTNTVATEISTGKIPRLSSIICNAYFWDLTRPAEATKDGYDKTFQISYLAHVALVLRLLGSFQSTGGRIIVFSSDSHWPSKNSLEKYPPTVPDDLNLLVKPTTNHPADNFGRGFQRYAVSKLASIMWMYALNGALKMDPKLSNITAMAINPGNLSDSRALRTKTPSWLYYMSKFIIQPLRPLLRFMDPTIRTSAEAGADVIELATNKAYAGERGYFTMLKKDHSSPESQDAEKQQKLWVKSAEWAHVTSTDTALQATFG